jgi:hypothetical protein
MKRKLVIALALVALAAAGAYVYAAVTVTSTFVVNANANLASVMDLVTVSAPSELKRTINLTSGVGANAADVVWSDTRTVTTAATDSLDLKGALVMADGSAFTPAKVRAIYISAATTNTTNLTIGADANSFLLLADKTDAIVLKPGGVIFVADPSLAGYAVTAATGDIILVTNAAGASATYSILIVGTSS